MLAALLALAAVHDGAPGGWPLDLVLTPVEVRQAGPGGLEV